jgi:hypothetical protein
MLWSKPAGNEAEEESVCVHATTDRKQIFRKRDDGRGQRLNILKDGVEIHSTRVDDFRVKPNVLLQKCKPIRDCGKPFTDCGKPFTDNGKPMSDCGIP